MFGELHIKPWELYKMTFREVILSINGLRDRDKMLEGWIRRSTLIIAASGMGGKQIAQKFDRVLWPVEGGAPKVSSAAMAQLQKFREAEALKRAKEKLENNG